MDFRSQVRNNAEVSSTKVIQVFSARSLKNLQHLRFAMDVDRDDNIDWDSSCYLNLFQAIAKLEKLGELFLAMPVIFLGACNSL